MTSSCTATKTYIAARFRVNGPPNIGNIGDMYPSVGSETPDGPAAAMAGKDPGCAFTLPGLHAAKPGPPDAKESEAGGQERALATTFCLPVTW
jgi:hypothetical protein